MKKTLCVALSVSALLFATTGCVTNPSKQDVGTVLGAVVGGVVGSQFGGGNGKTIFTIAGALAGAWAGSSVGRSMDAEDHRQTEETLRSGLNGPTNGYQSHQWEHDARQYESNVYPAPAPRGYDRNCKSFTQEVIVKMDGRSEVATTRGVACRNPRTGDWEIQPN